MAHVLPRYVLWFLLTTQIDAMASLEATSRALVALPPWTSGAVFLAVAVVVVLDEARFVRQLVLGPQVGVMRRQPVPPWAHGPGVASLLVVVGAPVMGLGLLAWRGPFAPWLWGAALLPAMLLGAARRPVATSLALGMGAIVVSLGHGAPWLQGPLAGLAWSVALPVLGWVAWRYPAPHDAPPATHLPRPSSAFAALLHRDALVLWRTERALVWGSLSMAPVAALVVWAARVNGPYRGWSLMVPASIVVAVVAPTCLVALANLARRLGRQLDPPSWPTTAGLRTGALVALACLPVTPAWAGAAIAGGTDLGASAQVGLATMILSVATGAVAFLARSPRAPNHGLFLWYLGLVLAALHVGGPLGSAIVAALGWVSCRRSLLQLRKVR